MKQKAQQKQKSYQEQEREIYMDYQRRIQMVRDHILNSKALDEQDQRLIEFLGILQERTYKNMVAIDPTSFKELVADPSVPECFKCAVAALKLLVAPEITLQKHEIEFLGMVYGFQQLAVDGLFTRNSLVKAKSELLRYLMENNKTTFGKLHQYEIQIQNMVQLAENIIGFVEIYDEIMGKIEKASEENMPKVPVQSLVMTPTNKDKDMVKRYQSPQSQKTVKKIAKEDQSQRKRIVSEVEDTQNDESIPQDTQAQIQQQIVQNRSNLKQYIRDQLELKWKIDKETKLLERNLQRLKEQDDIVRQQQWRTKSQQLKEDQQKKDRYISKDMKDFNSSLKDTFNDSLQKFHQILRK